MKLVLLRLIFIRVAYLSLLLLTPLLIVQDTQGERDLVISRVLDSLPLVVIGLLGGLIVDRLGAARANRWALAIFSVPPLALVGVNVQVLPQWTLIPASLLVTSVAGVLTMCSDRLVLDLVPKDQLAKYNATAVLIERSCSLVLPPAVGAIALFSMDIAVYISAALAGLGSIALALLSPPPSDSRPVSALSLLGHIAEGFKHLVRKRLLFQLSIVVMFLNGIEAIALPYVLVLANNELNMNVAEIGLLSTIAAALGMVTAAVTRRIGTDRNTLLSVLVGSIFINAISHGLIVFLGSKAALYAATGITALSQVLLTVSYRTMRQDSLEKETFGVVSGALGLAVKFAMPAGTLIGGLILLRVGVADVFATAMTLQLVLGLIASLWIAKQFFNPALESA